ncbi:methyl-CpG-binding domain protein 1 isoform X6 [Zootoca vivipara]|uniref:methyl-CpG-binding domain protein 1 isoform X6 n=1 Tax=Zootoca vivipara TaxID=8524 RepID=UPI00293B87ED|nr:methyl-CpG-binding domain protein 1 isoform X6 [Zootoca vivipara]
MTEGWVDCPSLGPGWQRREVLRKNGTRPGQSDTYYTSPRGEKIRSRVELLRLLGGSRDLTDFDFKKGIFVDPSAEPQLLQPLPPTGGGHQRVKKGSKRHLPPLAAATPPLKKPPDLLVFEEPPDKELLDQKPPKLELELPVEAPAAILAEQQELLVAVDQPAMKPHKRRCRKHLPALLPPGKMGSVTVEEANPEEPVVCCASCQGQFPGVMLPSQRRCRWLCPDCRAQRRDFNREQRYYKGLECGMCQACKTTEDCGSCRICLRRQKPGMKRQWKCLKRRCLKRKKKIPPKKDGYSTKKLTVEVLSTEETFTPARRQQKKSAPVTDGPAPKVQRAPRGRHKRLSAAPPASTDGPLPKAQLAASCHRRKRSATTKWKPTMERDPGGIPTVRQRKKQLGAVKERKKPGRPPKHPTAQLKNNVTSASRRNRKCGKCEACLLKMDCGRCDFCCDKPKFGGRNLKRQKCRWRQCLHFAMKRLLPEEWSSPEGAAGWKVRRRRNAFGNRKPTRIKQVGRRGAKGSGQKRRAKASFQPEESPSSREQVHLPRLQSPEEPEQQPAVKWKNEPEMSGSILAQDLAKDRPILPHVKEESEVPRHPTPPSQVLVKQSDTRRPAVSLIATSPVDKREHAEAEGDHQPSKDSPVSAGLPQCKRGGGTQGKELVVLDDEDDEEVEHLQQLRPPVIMEIYSLGGAQPLAQLDSVLHELLAELNEIPLPAHWEVLSPLCGPDLRLVQRSEHSTVSSAAIYIRPGLFFQVVVRNLPVPPEHELYASHPARLTTVDEVVELICDLEAYRLCSGWPAGWHAGQRSEACDVLVYSGCCPQCRLNPWPSGRGAR